MSQDAVSGQALSEMLADAQRIGYASAERVFRKRLEMSKHKHKEVISLEAYEEYKAQGHGTQSFDTLMSRGGFDRDELITLLFCRVKRLEGEPIKWREAFTERKQNEN